MNEEEIIINCLKEFLKYNHLLKYRRIDIVSITKDEYLAIQELLNLYNKEKEKNNSISIQYEKVVDKLEDLEQIEKEHKEENGRLKEEIYKKDKIINLMAEMIVTDHEWFYSEFDNYKKQDFIKYFTNKVKEDTKE